jgi:hypothetical protein
LSAPSSTYKIPTPEGFSDGATEALIAMPPFPPQIFKLLGFLESDSNIAAHFPPLKYDNSIEAFLTGVHRGSAAIDLEPVCLNGNLELTGARIRAREVSLDKFDVRIRVIDPDRIRAAALTCLIDPQQGWLYSTLVALTSRTADAELSLPSFDVITRPFSFDVVEIAVIVFLL